MKQKLLTVVKLSSKVREYVEQFYDILTQDQLNDSNVGEIEVIMSDGTGIVHKDLLDRLPNVKLIDNFGVGYDGVDVEECRKRDIAICTTPGVLTDDVADLALAFILNLGRGVASAQRFLESGKWRRGFRNGLATKVTGKNLGIIGLGRIGSAVARRAAAFDMKIYYYDEFVTNDSYVKCDSLTDLASKVEFLVICAAATPENHNIVDEDVINALGRKGYLINVARGSLVDEEVLADYVKRGLIKGAALDVFVHEPKVPKPFRGRDNVIVTPHIASATRETRAKMAEIVIGNLKAFREGTEYLTRLKL